MTDGRQSTGRIATEGGERMKKEKSTRGKRERERVKNRRKTRIPS